MPTTVENPKVTIVMPVFNGGRYFQIALESALAQTYENLEIVVVNDGSTDGGETESIALRYGSRIRYIRQENKGVGGALNAGIREMTGDFFAWLSYENIHLPHKTAWQIAFFRRLSKPEAMLFSDYELIDSDGKVICPANMPHQEFVSNPLLPFLNGGINGCTLLISASILKRFGPFDENLRYTQDYDLWNKILAEHTFFHQPKTLVQYRVHPNQDSHNPAAAVEGDALWIRMLDSRTSIERAQISGSRRRYFVSLARFLEKTPYKRAARYASERKLALTSRKQQKSRWLCRSGTRRPKLGTLFAVCLLRHTRILSCWWSMTARLRISRRLSPCRRPTRGSGCSDIRTEDPLTRAILA